MNWSNQKLDTGPVALVSTSGNVNNLELERERQGKRERAFELMKAANTFLAAHCPECQPGCCKRDWHHVGDFCLHCGNDERGPDDV